MSKIYFKTAVFIFLLIALEVWDGKSPTYWGGGALPFLNIK